MARKKKETKAEENKAHAIGIGDEIAGETCTWIVTSVGANAIMGFTNGGIVKAERPEHFKDLQKTGRHFPEIAKILEYIAPVERVEKQPKKLTEIESLMQCLKCIHDPMACNGTKDANGICKLYKHKGAKA